MRQLGRMVGFVRFNNSFRKKYLNYTYNQGTDGKKGEALKTVLCQIINSHTSIGYDGLWTAYAKTDKRADGAAFTNKAHKAYLSVPGALVGQFHVQGYPFSEALTGIDALNGDATNAESNNAAIFDLSVRRMTGKHLARGIY